MRGNASVRLLLRSRDSLALRQIPPTTTSGQPAVASSDPDPSPTSSRPLDPVVFVLWALGCMLPFFVTPFLLFFFVFFGGASSPKLLLLRRHHMRTFSFFSSSRGCHENRLRRWRLHARNRRRLREVKVVCVARLLFQTTARNFVGHGCTSQTLLPPFFLLLSPPSRVFNYHPCVSCKEKRSKRVRESVIASTLKKVTVGSLKTQIFPPHQLKVRIIRRGTAVNAG